MSSVAHQAPQSNKQSIQNYAQPEHIDEAVQNRRSTPKPRQLPTLGRSPGYILVKENNKFGFPNQLNSKEDVLANGKSGYDEAEPSATLTRHNMPSTIYSNKFDTEKKDRKSGEEKSPPDSQFPKAMAGALKKFKRKRPEREPKNAAPLEPQPIEEDSTSISDDYWVRGEVQVMYVLSRGFFMMSS